jgi:hypothetical protein
LNIGDEGAATIAADSTIVDTTQGAESRPIRAFRASAKSPSPMMMICTTVSTSFADFRFLMALLREVRLLKFLSSGLV